MIDGISRPDLCIALVKSRENQSVSGSSFRSDDAGSITGQNCTFGEPLRSE